MLIKKILGGAAITALGVAIGGNAFAQETTSALRGDVVSTDGAPIAGAQVIITHVPTGTRSITTTNAAGVFDARGLRVGGPYTVDFDAQDYRGERYENLFLTVGDVGRLDVDLEKSEAEIFVTATPSAGSGAPGSVKTLDRDDIVAVVSIQRDLRDLARRDPLVSQDLGRRGGGGAGGISIAGSAPRSNRIAVDGVSSGDDFGLNTSGLSTLRGPVSLEAIEQFAVEASPLDVENGDFNGGALNIVLRQGTNNFEGSAFVNYLNDGLAGEGVDGRPSNVIVTQDNWGAFLSGPILKDRLFFALSYETYESADVTERGFTSAFANRFNGLTGSINAPLTETDLSNILVGGPTSGFDTYASSSRFQTGSVPLTRAVIDKKYSGRIDWNINDDHRVTLTHRYTESGSTVRNVGATNVRLLSNWYDIPEEEYVTSAQLNSNWTDRFSTELRVSEREYVRGQVPVLGRDRGEISICLENSATGPTSGSSATTCESNRPTLFLGPDVSRHSNALETTNTQVSISGEYALGDIVFKAGAQTQEIDIFNLFVQRSRGAFAFDTLAGFEAGQLASLRFNFPVSGRELDGAANFTYRTDSVFAQATWDYSPTLTLTGGLRYDAYTSEDRPRFNQFFRARNGFSNQKTYDGLSVLMPRFSFDWDASERVQVSGSLGIVSGGLPDVFLSNSYSNTGVVTNEINIQRSTSNPANCSDANNSSVTYTTADCALLLNLDKTSPDTFYTLPALALARVQGGGAPVLSTVNALASDFKMPSDWRGNLSLRWDALDFVRLGLDVVAVRSKDGLAFYDGRAIPLTTTTGQQLFTPDGRLRYDGLSRTNAQRTTPGAAGFGLTQSPGYSQIFSASGNISAGANGDLIAYNPGGKKNYSVTAAVSAEVSLPFNIDATLSYARQKAEDYGTLPLFATTNGYDQQYTSLDPNRAVYGRSNNEIEQSIKVDVSWSREFLDGFATRLTLFGEWRTGTPLTLLQDDGSNRSITFGTSRSDYLLYMPNLNNPRAGATFVTGSGASAVTNNTIVTDDPNVVFANRAAYDYFVRVQRYFELPTGQILEKGVTNNPDVTRLDLQFQQEFPGALKGHKSIFTVDVSNVLNLLNDEWGTVKEFGIRRTSENRVADYVCAAADGNPGTNGDGTCARYFISNVNTNLLNPTINPDNSRWYIQLGLKYQF